LFRNIERDLARTRGIWRTRHFVRSGWGLFLTIQVPSSVIRGGYAGEDGKVEEQKVWFAWTLASSKPREVRESNHDCLRNIKSTPFPSRDSRSSGRSRCPSTQEPMTLHTAPDQTIPHYQSLRISASERWIRRPGEEARRSCSTQISKYLYRLGGILVAQSRPLCSVSVQQLADLLEEASLGRHAMPDPRS
jgi:hypothetical protein